jgi:hypothetical protein
VSGPSERSEAQCEAHQPELLGRLSGVGKPGQDLHVVDKDPHSCQWLYSKRGVISQIDGRTREARFLRERRFDVIEFPQIAKAIGFDPGVVLARAYGEAEANSEGSE